MQYTMSCETIVLVGMFEGVGGCGGQVEEEGGVQRVPLPDIVPTACASGSHPLTLTSRPCTFITAGDRQSFGHTPC